MDVEPNDSDRNSQIAALLRDLADAQGSSERRFGYKRAAQTVMNLEQPIEEYVDDRNQLRKIPNLGPSSERVVTEVLRTGHSDLVERIVAASPNRDEIERSRSLREHFLSRARVNAALAGRPHGGTPEIVYRGDLQMHSVWSDGSQTLEDIVRTGLERGYEYAAVTDHSYGLPIAGGLSMERLADQHREIDALNERYRGRFRLLKGIEANIRPDGRVDMTEEELGQLEIVVAAPHSALRVAADQTERLLRAIRTPGVHVLGHPRGRLYGRRPGVSARWDVVFRAAAEAGVAVEIDGDPWRQDLDYTLAAQAAEAGCFFALDSDAHGAADWSFADIALAHARLAGVPTDRIINGWPFERLKDWLALKRCLC